MNNPDHETLVEKFKQTKIGTVRFSTPSGLAQHDSPAPRQVAALEDLLARIDKDGSRARNLGACRMEQNLCLAALSQRTL